MDKSHQWKDFYAVANDSVSFPSNPMLGFDSHGAGFAGHIAELLFFPRGLTPSEREAVGRYLNVRYAWIANVPSPPGGVAAAPISPSQVSVAWTNSLNTNTVSFQIERRTNSGPYALLASVRDATSYVDTNAVPACTNTYRLKAMNYAGISAYSAEVSAVTPNSGVIMPFSSLALWLKADAGIVLNTTNNTIGLWLDQSGHTNDATVSDPTANEPAFVDAVLNVRPVIRFDGSGRFFNLANFPTTMSSAEAFVVLKSIAPGSLAYWAPTDGPATAYPDGAGVITDNFGRPANVAFGIPPLQRLDQYHLYDVYTAAWQWTNRINGRLYGGTDNIKPVFGSNPKIGIGRPSGASPFNGDMAEILIFNKTLTREEREVVGAYLNSKYAFLSTAPPLPGGVTATGLRPYEIQVAWTNAELTNGLTYTIERKSGMNGVYAPIMVLTDTKTYVDTGAFPGTNFGYRIKSWNFNGYSGYSSEVLTPAVVITNPQPQTVFSTGTNIVVGAIAVAGAGSISKVDFFVNRNLYATVTSPPYAITINNLGFGASTVAAKATDSLGNSAFSAHIVVIVSPDTDGDGFSDYAEIQAGTDPNNPLSYPYTPPGDPSDHTPPTIFLDEPSNATQLP